ncbi:MAG: methylated-DNA--[Lachnospiraceae bacterium]|jgi:methylated-DNA-[protein]-cysteine S-methyltransferase|nr:methylated-DNA--[protein]-cysteine S-methyltransferase [Lachnospiraceae bacterium]MBR2532414.1 methylated-DNA--[protein]-cysteine S-methyltransferase [Lachnospiraceae bacterium]
MLYETLMETPFGVLRLKADDEALTYAGFVSTAGMSEADRITNIERDGRLAAPLALALDWYGRYFDGQAPDPSEVPIRPEGSSFRREVWEIVRQIPYGQVLSYGEIARIIAARRGIPRMAAQAVGGAMKANRIFILIPCHRVIGADGSMVGYGSLPDSLELKRALLRHEGILWT